MGDKFEIRPATEADCELVLHFIRRLADYEKLLDQVTATVDDVRRELFSEAPTAHALIAYEGEKAVGFALYFHMGMIGTWIAMFADWIVKALIFTYRYLSGKWIKFKYINA